MEQPTRSGEDATHDDPCYVISVAARPRNTRCEGLSMAEKLSAHPAAHSIAFPSGVSLSINGGKH